MAPGGDYSIHKDLMTSPMDHLHRFQEMLRIAELMPAGDIPPPNAALQVEWFYMTFHKSDRSEYVRSGRLLEEETIVSLAEYFERLYNAHLLDGSLQKKRDEQIRRTAKSELRHDLEERYKRKLRDFERRRASAAANRTWHRRERDYKYDRDRRDYGDNRATNKDARGGERKASSEGSTKAACHIHGPESKHSYAECRQNPKNRSASDNNNKNYVKKRTHDAHYHDERHDSSEDVSRAESGSPTYSDGEVSENESRDGTPAENYHLDNYHIPKKVRRMDDVGHKSPRPKTSCGAVVNCGKKKDKKPSSSARMASSSEPKLNFEEFFPDDASMDSIVHSFAQMDEDGLSIHDTSDAFNFGN